MLKQMRSSTGRPRPLLSAGGPAGVGAPPQFLFSTGPGGVQQQRQGGQTKMLAPIGTPPQVHFQLVIVKCGTVNLFLHQSLAGTPVPSPTWMPPASSSVAPQRGFCNSSVATRGSNGYSRTFGQQQTYASYGPAFTYG